MVLGPGGANRGYRASKNWSNWIEQQENQIITSQGIRVGHQALADMHNDDLCVSWTIRLLGFGLTCEKKDTP